MQDSTGRYTYAYDPVDRKTVVALPSTQRMTSAFDAVGQRCSLIAPTGGRFSYSFDQGGALAGCRTPRFPPPPILTTCRPATLISVRVRDYCDRGGRARNS